MQAIKYLLNMAPYMLIALPLIILSRFIFYQNIKKKGLKTSVLHEIGVITLFVFFIGIASQTIIPKIEFGNGNLGIVGGDYGNSMNLIPFKQLFDIYQEVLVRHNFNYFIINIIGNILMFFPIGLCIPVLWRNVSFKKIVFIAASSSLMIELFQLPQARGTDIDDIIINTLGAIIGYGIYIWLNKLFPQLIEKFKIGSSVGRTKNEKV